MTRKAKQQSRQRDARESEQRRDGRHCPVCLAVLPRMASSGGSASRCPSCAAQPARARCARCGAEAVWHGEKGAACASCGHHGSKVTVIAGHDWIARDGDEK